MYKIQISHISAKLKIAVGLCCFFLMYIYIFSLYHISLIFGLQWIVFVFFGIMFILYNAYGLYCWWCECINFPHQKYVHTFLHFIKRHLVSVRCFSHVIRSHCLLVYEGKQAETIVLKWFYIYALGRQFYPKRRIQAVHFINVYSLWIKLMSLAFLS